MNASDWEYWYQANDTPWDKGEPAPGLLDFLHAHPELPRARVCVPGCGAGHDVRAWAEAGFDATGYDFAPTAVRRARELSRKSGLTAAIIEADFLKVQTEQPFDWLFEHTLFSAIQPDQRDEYVQAVLRFLKPGGDFLAIHFLISDTDGPPFGTSREELMRRFASHFELIDEWEPRSWPNRVHEEMMYWWRRKPV